MPDYDRDHVEGSVVPGDPAYRRRLMWRAVIVAVCGVVAAYGIWIWFETWQAGANRAPEKAYERMLGTVRAMVTGVSIAAVAAAITQLITGMRIWRAGRFPYPGMRVARDTVIRTGRAARFRAIVRFGIALALGAVCPPILWSYAGDLGHEMAVAAVRTDAVVRKQRPHRGGKYRSVQSRDALIPPDRRADPHDDDPVPAQPAVHAPSPGHGDGQTARVADDPACGRAVVVRKARELAKKADEGLVTLCGPCKGDDQVACLRDVLEVVAPGKPFGATDVMPAALARLAVALAGQGARLTPAVDSQTRRAIDQAMESLVSAGLLTEALRLREAHLEGQAHGVAGLEILGAVEPAALPSEAAERDALMKLAGAHAASKERSDGRAAWLLALLEIGDVERGGVKAWLARDPQAGAVQRARIEVALESPGALLQSGRLEPGDLAAMEAFFASDSEPPVALALEKLRAGEVAQWVEAVRSTHGANPSAHGDTLAKAVQGRHARLWLDGALYAPEDLAALAAAADQVLADPKAWDAHKGARKARDWVRRQSTVKARDPDPGELAGEALHQKWEEALQRKAVLKRGSKSFSERTAKYRARMTDAQREAADHQATARGCQRALLACLSVLRSSGESLTNGERMRRCEPTIPSCPRGNAAKEASATWPCCPERCRAPMREVGRVDEADMVGYRFSLLRPPCIPKPADPRRRRRR